MLSLPKRFEFMEKEFSEEKYSKFTPKINKAKKMVLTQPNVFYRVEANGDTLIGVVKSQTSDDRIYSAYLRSDGSYGCQTQRLNTCGGLRGTVCKHILTLVASASQNKTIMKRFVRWLKNSTENRPLNDKDLSTYIFQQYEARMNIQVLGVNFFGRFHPIHHADNFPIPSTIKIIDSIVEGEVKIEADGNLQNTSTTVRSVGTGEKMDQEKAIEEGWLMCTGCEQWFSLEDQEAFKEDTDCLSALLGLAKEHPIKFN